MRAPASISLPTGAERSAVVGKAVVRAAVLLGMTNADLARTIDHTETHFTIPTRWGRAH